MICFDSSLVSLKSLYQLYGIGLRKDNHFLSLERISFVVVFISVD